MNDFSTASILLKDLYSFAITSGWIGMGFLILMILIIVMEEWMNRKTH